MRNITIPKTTFHLFSKTTLQIFSQIVFKYVTLALLEFWKKNFIFSKIFCHEIDLFLISRVIMGGLMALFIKLIDLLYGLLLMICFFHIHCCCMFFTTINQNFRAGIISHHYEICKDSFFVSMLLVWALAVDYDLNLNWPK